MSRGQRLVALIDETAGDKVYRVGALVTPAHRRLSLTKELDAVMARAAAQFGVDPTIELHGHRLFHGLDGWTGLYPRQRIAVYGWALEAVALHSEIIFFRGVDRPRHRARYNGRFSEHEAALMYTLEEVDTYAHFTGSPVDVVADDCRFAGPARTWLARAQQQGTWGYRKRHLLRIENLDFVDSAGDRGVQAIDLVAYLKNRISSRADAAPKAKSANAELWRRVGKLVRIDKVWSPK